MATALVLDTNASRMNAPETGDAAQERDLVGRAQDGDLAAFEALYHAYAGRVFALCLRLTGDRGEASNLLQDAFVRAWERLSSFRGEAALTTWLHRLTVNCFLEEARKTRRREARFETQDLGQRQETTTHGRERSALRALNTPARPEPSLQHATPDVAQASDVRLDLAAALPQLPEGARRVFVLHDMYGYRHEEIASLLGIAAATVRVQLFRARRQLMEILNR